MSTATYKTAEYSVRGATRINQNPGTIAGIAGMILVAALYIAHALLTRTTGHGLSALWLLMLILPGILAAHLARRAEMPNNAQRAGVQSGLLTAHFAAVLQVVVLVIGVLNVDWTAYSAQVGSQIANGVREMAAPATAVASVALIAVTYTGCTLASWLGALIYTKVARG